MLAEVAAVNQKSNTHLQSIRKGEKNEDALAYASKLADWWMDFKDLTRRKSRGQFFTPRKISVFMASLFTISKSSIKVLDAGAGVGILSAALCWRLSKFPRKLDIMLDAYENDPNLLPSLKALLETCKSELEGKGHSFTYNIYEQDFILHNEKYFKENLEPIHLGEYDFYDCIMSNPPYYKLHKNSPQATIMRDFISGHPNIYALFMALSTKMLKPDGEMVFITPRSFCSGYSYKRFRKWFLKTVNIKHIHIFESRKGLFERDSVLQENIIIKATKSKENHEEIRVSSSKSKSFEIFEEINVVLDDIIFHKNGDTFIRIPSSQKDVNTLRFIDSWPFTLKDLGFQISTGPVVIFRTRQNLRDESGYKKEVVPLIWMHNFGKIKVKWPVKKNKKPLAIEINDQTKPILLPVKNYVLVKRFSPKEQKRRLYATVLLEEEFPHTFVGIENHVNYIHKLKGELTTYEAIGLAALLNTTIVDNYFRSLNGNTQVNANDIRSLPLPPLEDIATIGERVTSGNNRDFDDIVAQVLDIELGH